jgi:hypothetical protein
MTRDTPSDGPITTTEAFETALGELLDMAVEQDIDPRGSWVCRNGGEHPDLEVVVVELEKTEPPD